MKKKKASNLWLMVLAVVFTIGLTFASVALPELIDNGLEKITPRLEGDSHRNDTPRFRTRVYLDHSRLRIIGYACFILMLVLIIVGLTTRKSGLGSAGAFLMFLPVFAQFAGVMFFLAGLGIFNLFWMPILDLSPAQIIRKILGNLFQGFPAFLQMGKDIDYGF